MATDGTDDLAASDAAILDALYRETEADALDDAQRATLDEWRVVRGVVRHARDQGFDIEPPAAGTRGSFELLMTAARAHATPARPGLWARLRAGLMTLLAHPAMAGAAALVVVGGAAGVLYLKGQHRVVRPESSERRPMEAPTAPRSPITDGELGDVLAERQPADRPGPAARRDVGGVSADQGEPGSASGAGSASVTEHRSERPAVPAKGGPVREQKPPPRPTSVEGADKQEPADSNAQLEEAPPGAAASEDEETGAFGGPAAVSNTATASPPMASPPPAPPPPPVKAPAPSAPTPQVAPVKPKAPAQIAVDDAAPVVRAPSARVQAEQLTAQARTAAKAGDCATVAARSKQVAALDAGYHRDVFVRDPDIARCR